MHRHFTITLDGISGATVESDLILHTYHRTEPGHFESGKDNPEKVLMQVIHPWLVALIRDLLDCRRPRLMLISAVISVGLK